MRAPSRSALIRAAAIVALLAAPTAAAAYGILLHDRFPVDVLGGRPAPGGASVRATMLPGATDADLSRFRGWLYARAASLADTTLRGAFLRRYPTPAAFTARAFKEFVMVDGGATILGVDSFTAVYRARSAQDATLDPHPPYLAGTPLPLELALQLGSDYVDLDRRNTNRLLRDAAGRPLRTSAGDSVPFDPMTLNMGRLTGLSSQAHAHYGFNHNPKSPDPGVLRKRPWDFAIAIGFGDSVETFAEANAQLYTDLSLLALLEGSPGARTLSALYAGNAFHYVGDVGNSIHTLQAGIFGFFIDATLYRWWRRTITLFGLLGPTASRNSIGLDIVSNHHLLSEQLFQVELAAALRLEAQGKRDSVSASMQAAITALRTGDLAFRARLAAALERARAAGPHRCDCPAVGTLVTAAVIEDGNRDGAEIYRLTRDLAVSRIRRPPGIDFDTIPGEGVWRFINRPRSRATARRVAAFNVAQARGLARVHEALDLWWQEYDRASAADRPARAALAAGVLRRFVTARLQYLGAAEARRRTWLASHGGLLRP